MKRKIIAGLLVIASVATIFGCGTADDVESGNTGRQESGTDDDKAGGQSVSGGVSDYEFEERDMKDSNVVNSSIVTDMIAEANSGTNVMYSPTSLNMALGLVGEGASGEAADMISSFLGSDSYGDRASELLTAFETYNVKGGRNGYDQKLQIANALWVDKRLGILSSFVDVAEDKYQATVENVDFTKPAKACKTINKWAKQKTYGLVPQILSEDMLSEDSRLVITNSVYFEAPWQDEWSVYGSESDFTLLDGSTQQVYFMYSEGNSYFENEYATAFSKRYTNGIEFIGILPNAEGEFTLEGLDIEGLLNSRSNSFDILNIKMPRLNFETSNDLKDVFIAMGMGKLFERGAGIDGIADECMHIAGIVQKTKLELDEYGTKAAAVTAVVMEVDGCAPCEEEPVIKYVYLDRPFAFLIYDRNNDEILFMGKVVTALE